MRFLESLYDGMGFLGHFAVGQASMMGRWKFVCWDIWKLVGFLEHVALGKASMRGGLSAWVSWVCGLRAFLVKAIGVLNGTFDISSCLT